jgi:hypothetical protein
MLPRLVPRAHQLEEDHRPELVQWQVTHFVDDQYLRRQIDLIRRPPLPIRPPRVVHQIVRYHEVRRLAGADRRLRQGDRDVRLATRAVPVMCVAQRGTAYRYRGRRPGSRTRCGWGRLSATSNRACLPSWND